METFRRLEQNLVSDKDYLAKRINELFERPSFLGTPESEQLLQGIIELQSACAKYLESRDNLSSLDALVDNLEDYLKQDHSRFSEYEKTLRRTNEILFPKAVGKRQPQSSPEALRDKVKSSAGAGAREEEKDDNPQERITR